MAKFTDQQYDQFLWDEVMEKSNGESKELAETDIGRAQIARFKKANRLGNIRDTTREKLLSYIGYSSFEAFKEKTDKKLDDAVPTSDSINTSISFYSKFHINMPAWPEYFLGRELILHQLHKQLVSHPQRDKLLLLSSMGGMGKTTVLHEYLNRPHCRMHFNWIISISVHKNLETAFVQGVAAALQVDLSKVFAPGKCLETIIQAMQHQDGENLVAIDNINESDYEALVGMRDHFRRSGWNILITTRTKPDGFNSIDLQELEIEDAQLLFLHHYAPQTVARDEESLLKYMNELNLKADLKKLLNHIKCHTLFTELLAKTGNKNLASPAVLLKQLEEQDMRHPELARKVVTGAHAYNAVNKLNTATLHQYMLSIFDTEHLLAETQDEELAAENRSRVIMLHFFSVLPAFEIPIEHLRLLWNVDEQGINEFKDRLDVLKQTGWIKGEQSYTKDEWSLTYKMHHLIQEVVYEKLKPNEYSCTALIETMGKLLEERRTKLKGKQLAIQEYLAHVFRKLEDLGKN